MQATLCGKPYIQGFLKISDTTKRESGEFAPSLLCHLYCCALQGLLSQEYPVKPDSKVSVKDFGKDPLWESLIDAAD